MPPRQLSLFDDVALDAPGAAPPAAARASAPAAGPLTWTAPASPKVRAVAAPEPAAVFRHPQAQRDIRLGEHIVGYALRRSRRRSIGFVIGADGLTVSAPRWVGIGDVESALQAKTAWILRKLQQQRERSRRLHAARVDWRDGAAVPFLGRDIVVRLNPAGNGALLDGDAGVLHLGLPRDAEPERIRDAVQSWLQRQARRIFDERCSEFAPRLGVRMKRLSLSSATTRWGSASADGSVRLNWRLVHFGLPVIDYVVAHELAHLREMNHSAAFWDVVRSALPGYAQARGALRDAVAPVFD